MIFRPIREKRAIPTGHRNTRTHLSPLASANPTHLFAGQPLFWTAAAASLPHGMMT